MHRETFVLKVFSLWGGGTFYALLAQTQLIRLRSSSELLGSVDTQPLFTPNAKD